MFSRFAEETERLAALCSWRPKVKGVIGALVTQFTNL